MKKQIGFLAMLGLVAFCSSAHAQVIPGGVASAGLTYVVPDMLVWYNMNQLPGHPFPGYITNGPILNLGDQLGNTARDNANWDQNVSVLGDSTFLVTTATFADDGSWNGSTNAMHGGVIGNNSRPNERCIVVFQPATGGAPKIGETYYDDFGQPYRLHKSLRNRNTSPAHVAGDKRSGGTNFMAEALASLWYCKLWFGIDYFNSDGRFSTNLALYATGYPSGNNNDGECVIDPRYTGPYPPGGAVDDVIMGTVQTYSLNPGTLVQTPRSKAQTSAYFSKTNLVPVTVCNNMFNNGCDAGCGNGGSGDNWLGYRGGVVALDNGNFVSVVSDPTAFVGGTIGNEAAVATIFGPDGTVVKDAWLVDPQDVQMNVAAYKGGFCVRVHGLLYFFDNNGTPTHTNTVASSGVGFSTDRGGSTRIASDIRSHYVYLAGPVGANVYLGIWNALTGAFVTSAIVSSDLTPASVGNTELAVDALDRVCVAFEGGPTSSYLTQVMARVLRFDGANVTVLTPTFFPFVNSDTTNSPSIHGFTTTLPAVGMTTKQICIAAKGSLNSTNNPAGGPDTWVETTVYTVFTTPLGGADSVGLTHIVPDMLLWYNTNNYYTNGPITVGAAAPNAGIWDAYASVVSDSTFLVANVTYANTYPGGLADLCFALALQPAAGGPPKLGYELYADDGTPYLGLVSNRKTGPPGRVVGDKRLGATNYLTGAHCDAGDPAYTGLTAFQSDGRWNINPNYVGSGRYPVEQVFSLNPATLVPTPRVKAFDFTYGRTPSGPVGTAFGDVLCLSDGNFAIITDDGTHNLYNGQTATIVIIRPDGSIVKDTFAVDPSATAAVGIWANCAAYRGGFCVRWNNTLYFFDNAGNPRGSIADSSSGIAFGVNRGDRTRLASDIRSHYVYLAGVAPYAEPAHTPVYLAIWDPDTTNFVTSAIVSDTDPSQQSVGAVNVAVDALDRIIVGYDLQPSPAFPQPQVAVRIMQFDGTKVTYLTRSFFPFVNHDEIGSLGLTTVTPGLAMTTKYICISAKGTINSTNNPAGGPDTPANINLYTVINHPAPVELRPTLTITRSGNKVVLSWADPAGLGWTPQTSLTVQPTSWSTAGTVVQVGSIYYSTNAIATKAYFRLVH